MTPKKTMKKPKKIPIKTTIEAVDALVDKAWNDGYHRGTADCAADYECGLRKVKTVSVDEDIRRRLLSGTSIHYAKVAQKPSKK